MNGQNGQNVFVNLDHIFYRFSPMTTQNIKILKRWKKKAPGDVIILHMCTINGNHMMYDVWDMKRYRQIFLSFWAIFWPFYLTINRKINIFYASVSKIMYVCFTVPEIWHVTDVIFIFHFWPFLTFYTTNCAKNQNFEKVKTKAGDITILHMYTKNYNPMMYYSWDMVCDGQTDRMDGQTDRKSDV